ncbi:hypothetical protein HDV05_006086 [Chytridiales sp. JEL 0842]|nr:hypothetical protein HDV05_006086 [Chytridiales sp. JEL 0842]
MSLNEPNLPSVASPNFQQQQSQSQSQSQSQQQQQQDDSTLGTCRVCNSPAAFMCSLCGPETHYCSPECQTQDWAGHRRVCKGVQRQMQEAAAKKSEMDRKSSVVSASANAAVHGMGSGSSQQGSRTALGSSNSMAGPSVAAIGDSAGAGPSLTRDKEVDAAAVQALGASDRNSDSGSIRSRKVKSKVRGRGNVAQWINRNKPNFTPDNLAHPPSPTSTHPAPSNTASTNPLTDPDTLDELRYYLNQIYLILTPVIICILLSVLWVKLTTVSPPYYQTGVGKESRALPDIYNGGAIGAVGGGSGSDAQQSLITALIILAQIVVVTFIVFLLFKYNQMKILFGIFGVIILGLLGLFGFTLGFQLLSTFNAPFDYITFGFFLWNLAVQGLVSVFWKGPLILQQIYLVLISSLMAFSLTNLPALTSWILLALLAIWDLIAVLCPFGPLRLLIEESKKEEREIPALLYTAMIWMMATPPSGLSTSSLQRTKAASAALPSPIDPQLRPMSSSSNLVASPAPLPSSTPPTDLPTRESPTSQINLPAPIIPSDPTSPPNLPIEDTTTPHPTSPESEEEEEEEGGMKLGLGDFVFYSVLVSRAAQNDWITTVSSIIAVLTGLNMTIFLLVLYQKALPALPISILLGLIFYFLGSVTLVPLYRLFVNRPGRLVVDLNDPQGLWAGVSGGGGFVYV